MTSLTSRHSTLCFRNKQKRYRFFQSTDLQQSCALLQTHVHRTHQLKYSSAELLNPELIQQTDKNPGQSSRQLRKHSNLDPYVLTGAPAVTSFKRVTVPAEYLTAPCSKAACLKAGAMLLKREPAPKGAAPQPGKLPLPLGRRGNINFILLAQERQP